MKKVFVILGPTSSGKTSLAIKLCKKFSGEIISADSRQIFKGMDIGTGKVPAGKGTVLSTKKNKDYWELNGIKVWGYDLVKPDKYFSAYDFALWALPVARRLLEGGKNVFLVGGTGFYVDLFTGAKKPSLVPPNLELRKVLESKTLEELKKDLMSLNPEVFAKIDQDNRVRLIRAIEIEKGSDKSPTPLPYLEDISFEFIGLTASNDFLYKRADRWLDAIWEGGVTEETKSLIDSGFSDTKPLNGLIYKTVKEFLQGELSEKDAKERCKFDLHAYIRRQHTYFKKVEGIKWFDITNSSFAEDISNHVESKLDG